MNNTNIKHHSQTIKKIYRIWGFHIARYLKNTPITANHITLSRIVLIFIASYFILKDVYYLHVFAAVLIILFSMFDALDGSVAMIKDQRSVLGAWLDPQTDRLGFLLLFLVMAYHLSTKHDFYAYLCFYTLMMFYFRGLVALDVRLKEKFILLREETEQATSETNEKSYNKKKSRSFINFLKLVHLEASPHTHNVAIYIALGLVINKLGAVLIFLSIYLTAWYLWENFKIIRKAKSL